MACIKGTAVLNTVKSLRKYGKERARQLLPPRLHRYLQDRIMASKWYPERDEIDLLRVLAQVLSDARPGMPQGRDRYVQMGHDTAQNDVVRLYGTMIRRGDVKKTVRLVNPIWRTYHDTGYMTTTILGPGRCRLELKDYETPSLEMCKIQIGWYTEVLAMTGATDVHIVEMQCRALGAPSCVWELTWK